MVKIYIQSLPDKTYKVTSEPQMSFEEILEWVDDVGLYLHEEVMRRGDGDIRD